MTPRFQKEGPQKPFKQTRIHNKLTLKPQTAVHPQDRQTTATSPRSNIPKSSNPETEEAQTSPVVIRKWNTQLM